MTSVGLIVLASFASAAGLDGPGDLLFTEYQADPSSVPEYYGEWFEVYNNSGGNVDLQGVTFTLESGAGFTVTSSLVVAAGDYVVFGASSNTSSNGGVSIDYAYDFFTVGFDLRHESGSLTATAGSVTLDELVWDDTWNVNRNKAHQVSPNAYDLEWANDLSQNWCSSPHLLTGAMFGTPGSANEWCTTDPGFDTDGDGFTETGGDCDDTDALIHPDALDGDDGVPQSSGGGGNPNDDADCDGVRDDGVMDDDLDGYTEVDGDCNDADVDVFPGAQEGRTADGEDNDCNGCADDLDGDGDGFGYNQSCPDSEDCDDNDRNVNPRADETPYDGVDQDCDGFDECDYDGDGYRGVECTDQVGNDCDDENPAVKPGAVEVDGDGVDNDCDGVIDTPDRDGDGVTAVDGDCMDISPEMDQALYEVSRGVYPGAVEVCGDLIDNDCDGFYDNLPDCTNPATYATVRGGGICGVTPAVGAPGALGLAAAMGLLAATRRRRGGEA